MELWPRRWIVAVMAVTALGLSAAVVIVAVAALAGGPWGLWIGAAMLLAGGATAARIAVIATRGVVVRGGRVIVTGLGGHDFDGDRLVGPLDQPLLGVRLTDGTTTRRVFAQLPDLSSTLVARLPEWHPQLRTPVEFPVVLPGRIGTPVAYGVVAVIGTFMGGWATMAGIRGPGADGPNRAVLLTFGPLFLVGAVATLWWVLWRAERRVEIHAERIERVVLLGRRRRTVAPFAAAVVVRSARTLPKSTLQREVHHLRRLGSDGSSIDLAPMLAAFPEYGEGEARLMDERAWRLHRLHDVPRRGAEIHRTSSSDEIALWDHGESSSGAHRHTLVLPFPVGGKRVVPLLHGRVAVGGSVADAVVSYDDRMLVLLDLRERTASHIAVESPIRHLDPGFRRIVTADGPLDLAQLAEGATSGWPRRWGPLGVPNTPWIPGLDRALAELDGWDDERADRVRALVVARAHEAAIDLLRGDDDEVAPRPLAPLSELARFDDPWPVTRCSGARRRAVLGPDGRPECRGCGVVVSSPDVGDHEWPLRPGACDGILRAPVRRHRVELRGGCPACGLDGPLTYDGLVRHHPRAAG